MAKRLFSSSSSLSNEISKRMSNAINLMANEVYEQLIFIIQEEVYGGDTGANKRTLKDDFEGYKRSYEFMNNAWAISMAKNISNNIVAKVFYYPQGMSGPSFSNPYKHGNFAEGVDRRKELASIINYGGTSNDYDLREFGARPFWDEFIKWLNKNWVDLVTRNFKKVGLSVFAVNIKNKEKEFDLEDIF